MASDPRTIAEVLDERITEWLKIDGVVGAGVGESYGAQCIKVFVQKGANRDLIPALCEGYRVLIEEIGEFRAMNGD